MIKRQAVKRRCGILTAACGAGMAHSVLGGIAYNVVPIGQTLNSGLYNSQAEAVNDFGQVVGNYTSVVNGTTTYAPYIYTTSSSTAVNVPGVTAVSSAANAYGINDSGVTVGTDGTNGFYYNPAVPSTTTFITPNSPGATPPQYGYTAQLQAVNATGAAAGFGNVSWVASGASFAQRSNHAITYIGGTATDIGINYSGPNSPSAQNSTYSDFAEAINKSGVVAGYGYNLATGKSDAFIYNASSAAPFTSIASAVLSAAGISTDNGTTQALGIDDAGDVVGVYTNGSRLPFIYHANGTVTDFTSNPYGGTGSTYFQGINNNGQIVGEANTGTVYNAFIYQNGTFTNLNTQIDPSLNFTLRYAYGISDTGYIVGYGTATGSTISQAYELSAVPEPASLALMSLGGLALLGRRRRQI